VGLIVAGLRCLDLATVLLTAGGLPLMLFVVVVIKALIFLESSKAFLSKSLRRLVVGDSGHKRHRLCGIFNRTPFWVPKSVLRAQHRFLFSHPKQQQATRDKTSHHQVNNQCLLLSN
jgi:hypothetical protein